MDKIKDYYLLCTMRNGRRHHLINEVPIDKIHIVVQKKELDDLMVSTRYGFMPKDTIIGGGTTHTTHSPHFTRSKVIVID